MKQVNVHEAKSTLSHLLKLAERGEEVVIARAGKPVACLTLIKPKRLKAPSKKRKFGGLEAYADQLNKVMDVDLSEAWQEFWDEDINNP